MLDLTSCRLSTAIARHVPALSGAGKHFHSQCALFVARQQQPQTRMSLLFCAFLLVAP